MYSPEARYALRYSLVLLVEAIADALTLILEADYGLAPESYRDAMLLAGERGIIPYDIASRLAGLASLWKYALSTVTGVSTTRGFTVRQVRGYNWLLERWRP